MKIVKYLISAVALLVLGACNHEPDEMVTPTLNPEFNKHSSVIVNEITAAEDFTLSWTAAKFGIETGVEYVLSASMVGKDPIILGSTTECHWTTKNLSLVETFKVNKSGSVEITFIVNATALATGESKASKPLAITFEYEKVGYMWILGGYQNWSASEPASRLLLGDDGIFRGFVNITSDVNGGNELKLCSQYGWDGTNYGLKQGVINTDDDAGNIVLSVGLHFLAFDIDNLKLVDIPVTKVGLIGEAVGGWDKDYVELLYNADNNAWVGSAKVTGDKAYKVRFNESWEIDVDGNKYDISLGGDSAALQFGGADLISKGSGIVSYTLNLFDYPYSIEEGDALMEKNDVLYIASSADNWNYSKAVAMSALYYDNAFSGQFCGMLHMPEAGEYLFARIPNELGTRYGGSASALVAYPGGETATALPAAAGLHYVHTDLRKATTINITSLGLVGGFNGWDASNPVELTYDATSKTYKASVTFDGDSEFKLVLNKCWNVDMGGMTHQMSLGGSCLNLVVNGSNLYAPAGDHTFEVDFHKTNITLAIDGKIADISPNPETLSITGAFGHYNWNQGDPTPALPLVGENAYAGIVDMYDSGTGATSAMFKVTYPNYSSWLGGLLRDGTSYTFDLAEPNGEASIPFGAYHWYIELDARAKTGVATATAVTPSLIGTIDGTNWDTDFPFSNEGNGIYVADIVLAANGEFKIRFNNDWGINLGATVAGAAALNTPIELGLSATNITVTDAGTYEVTLNLADMPNTVTIVKY